MKSKTHLLFLGTVSTLLLAGCTTSRESSSGDAKMMKAVAVLSPTQGNNVQGMISFTEEKGGVRVSGDIRGLTPGTHGFHVHDKGDCSAADGVSAGGHFNPTAQPHGGPNSMSRHAGDFGNIEANAQGLAHVNVLDSHISFTGTNSILNRAVIVHGKPDDLSSQPAGNAGPRVACGVIQPQQ